MDYKKLILIAGPTASGKSALTVETARRENGVIINADAMQVYDGLPILSSQPDGASLNSVPHKLYAVLDPSERSSAGRWRAMAMRAIEKAIQQYRTPILVGGTGLYFRALLGGLADIPDIPESVREQTRKLFDDLGEKKFRGELAQRDPESAARIARNDRQRLMRAYEVVAHTGQVLSEWHKRHLASGIWHPVKKQFQIGTPESQLLKAEFHLLLPPRDKLYAACDQRFLRMIEEGAVHEVEQFLTRKLDPDLPAMKTLGLREIAAHLRGEISLDEAIAKAQQATRNYAKRQYTWFRNQKIDAVKTADDL